MATQADVEELIRSLSPYFKGKLMSAEERAIWVANWCDDLASFSAEQLTAAAKVLRNGAEPNSPFPTPRQVKAAMAGPKPQHRAPNDPWREVDEAEWHAMDLHNKVRHREIQAANARQKAIDCLRATGSRDRANMPEEGLKLEERARWLEADAKRLRGMMSAPMRIAAE